MSEPLVTAAAGISTEILRSGAIGMFAMFFIVILVLLYLVQQLHKQMINQHHEHTVALFAHMDATNKIISTSSEASFELSKALTDHTKNYQEHAQILVEVKDVLNKLLYKSV